MKLIKEIFLQNTFASIKASIVIILLFILTKPITKRYTAGFRYYSWLAVMLIFLIPFGAMGINYTVNFSSLTNAVNTRRLRNWYEENAPTYSVTEEYNGYKRVAAPDGEEYEYAPVVKTATAKKQVDVKAILAVIWLIGALAYFALHIIRHIGFRRGLRRLYRNTDDDAIYAVLEREKRRLGVSKNIRLKIFSAVDAPLLTGLFRPEIILPHTDYTGDELHLILRHELFHFKHKDILYQFITLIFISLHWFNPFAYLMAGAIEIDCETSCDEKTLEGGNYDEKIFYGEMLIKLLKTEIQKKSYMTTTFFGGKNGMKKRLTLIASKNIRRKGTVAMAAITIIAIIISIGAAAMGNEYFDSVFGGDASYLADFIKTEKKSVEDDRFKLTLEQYLVAENQAMLICSFEAKTEDAVQEMNAVDERGYSTFNGIDFLNFGPTDFDKASRAGYTLSSLGEQKFDTENKRYYILKCDNIKNEERIDFYLNTDRIEDYPKIIVPMDYNMETKTIRCGDTEVKYNPISIKVTYPTASPAEDECDWRHWNGTYFYFRMKNGEIKTFNQLYEISGWGENYTKAWSREIIEPGKIKSVIVNDTEYPIDNPSSSKPITINERLKPFIIKPYIKERLWLPLREFCNGIGAEIEWDGAARSATVKYRGATYVVTAGSAEIQVNGETIDTHDKVNDNTAFIDENGRMIVSNLDYYMNVDVHRYNIHNESGNEVNPDAKLHIIP